jgi:hypothetical protein
MQSVSEKRLLSAEIAETMISSTISAAHSSPFSPCCEDFPNSRTPQPYQTRETAGKSIVLLPAAPFSPGGWAERQSLTLFA